MINISYKGDLDQIKTKLPYQEIKMSFQKSYGPQDFLFELLYTNANKKLVYLYILRWKESGRIQEKEFTAKDKIVLFLAQFIDKNGTLINNKKIESQDEIITDTKTDFDESIIENFDLESTVDSSGYNIKRTNKIRKAIGMIDALVDGDRRFGYSSYEADLLDDYLRRYFNRGEVGCYTFGLGINSKNTDIESIQSLYNLIVKDCNYYSYVGDIDPKLKEELSKYDAKIKKQLKEEKDEETEECSYCGKEMYWDNARDRMMCPDKDCEFHTWN